MKTGPEKIYDQASTSAYRSPSSGVETRLSMRLFPPLSLLRLKFACEGVSHRRNRTRSFISKRYS
jgi:hypothetical protein